MSINRRAFIRVGMKLPPAAILLSKSEKLLAEQNATKPPHIFVHLVVGQGRNAGYLFDARPVPFTGAGLFENSTLNKNLTLDDKTNQEFMLKAPEYYAPAGGGSAFIHPLGKNIIEKHGKKIAIINGVHMSLNDGHLDNTTASVTGSISARNGFAEKLYDPKGDQIFPFLASNLISGVANINHGLIQRPKELVTTLAPLSRFNVINRNDPIGAHLIRRYGESAFGSRVATSLDKAHTLSENLKKRFISKETESQPNNDFETPDADSVLEYIALAMELRLSDQFIITYDEGTFDAHSAQRTDDVLSAFRKFTMFLDKLIETMEKTYSPLLPQGDSVMAHTTLLVTTEFSRTNRQKDSGISSIFQSGTDHNPVGNSIILLGKGIRGGQVVGATDLDRMGDGAPTDPNDARFGAYGNASYIRSARPKELETFSSDLMPTGKPFDFSKQQVTDKIDSKYRPSNYITMTSVTNTLFKLFGVNDNQRVRNDESGSPEAKTLDRILT